MPFIDDKEIIEYAVNTASNLTEAMEMCGYVLPRAGNYKSFKKKCDEYNLDYSHLLYKKRRSHGKYTDEEVFQKESSIHTSVVKNHFIKGEYAPYECALCHCKEHNGKPITLRLDHINEDKTDNRLENLRLICPNCDSVLRTYYCHDKYGQAYLKEKKQTNISKIKPHRSNLASEVKPHRSNLAPKIKNKKNQAEQDRKDKASLLIALHKNQYFYVLTGKQYGISDNAIRKKCKKYHIYDFVQSKRKELGRTVISNRVSNDKVAELFVQTKSASYVAQKLHMSRNAVIEAKQTAKIHIHPIEWSSTTCHIVDSNLYFRTSDDAGHWLVERRDEMCAVHERSRGRKIRQSIEKRQKLFGYQFEYVSEEDYFDIIESHEVISYAYQEHREVPLQGKK